MTEPCLNRFFHRRIISPRMVCYTGFVCNLRCRFCYYLESLESGRAKNRTPDRIRRQLWIGRHVFKKTRVEFTGGEPTLMPEFVGLTAYARDLGYQEIGLITNGFRLAEAEYCRKLQQAGLNDVLFSFHSHEAETHDWLTRVPGSYDKLIQAVQNIRALGLNFRFNSVVTTVNSRTLNPLLRFLTRFEPQSINLIVFNPSEETAEYAAHDSIRLTSYDEIGARLSEAVVNFRDQVPVLNVRFIPFCFMKGHEAHVRNYWQVIYEAREWDPVLHMGYRKGFLKVLAALGAGFFMWPFTASRYGRKNVYTLACEWMQSLRITLLFRKPPACRCCALRLICGGFHREFFKKYGIPRVYPYEDRPLVRNPVLYAWPRYADRFPGLAAEKLFEQDSVLDKAG